MHALQVGRGVSVTASASQAAIHGVSSPVGGVVSGRACLLTQHTPHVCTPPPSSNLPPPHTHTDHDLEVKMRKVTDWLEAGHRWVGAGGQDTHGSYHR